MGGGPAVKPEPVAEEQDAVPATSMASAPNPLGDAPAAPSRRMVYASDSTKNDFCDNRVITSKYTWWNFLLLFLWAKFRVSG